MSMIALLPLLLALSTVGSVKTNDHGVKGATTHDLGAFFLHLDDAHHIATDLVAKAGPNAGESDTDLLIPTENRTGDGFLALGDLQLRFREVTSDDYQGSWVDASTHAKRLDLGTVVSTSNGNGAAQLTTNITPALSASISESAASFPLTVFRTWSGDNDSLILSFNLTNTGSNTIEIGALGVPTPWNNCFENATNAAEIWEQHFATDTAPSLHAGYTIANRFTGAGPSIATVPVGDTSLEAYRLNYPNGTVEDWWPPTLLDLAGNGDAFEGVFSWWVATKALHELDQKDADDNGFNRGQPWNLPTSLLLKPGNSKTVALRFVTASGPRQVEDRLKQFDRPVIVGVPGFVVARGEPFRLVVRSSVQPLIIAAEPAVMDFEDARSSSQHIWVIEGSARMDAFGRVRVTLGFDHPTEEYRRHIATAHYYVIKPHAEQLDALGDFRFGRQYFEQGHDYFNRSPSIISFDHSTMQQVTDDHRVWIAGLSDEAGSGSFVSAAAKVFARPDPEQVAKLEAFATQTLWGRLQSADPSSATYAAVRKSLFYYDAALLSTGEGGYNTSIRHDDSWNATEAGKLDRAYNYPHAVVVYWILYRLARNYDGLVKQQSWQWYLTRCVDTIVALNTHAGDAGDGLMEGTYFVHVLTDLKRENLTDAATQVESIMQSRADAWAAKQYPYASEFSWDNTAQEEVYAWSAYFNHSEAAGKTVETLMTVMSSVPHWAYSGTGRDMWDCMYSCKDGWGARLERIFHHYKGSQSSLALMNQFLTQPHDSKMLRAGYGGVLGPLASILEDGFGSTAFHSYSDYLDWDPLSGDNGVSIAVYALNARAVYVNDVEFGGHAGFGAAVSIAGNQVTVVPTDGIRRRVFLASIALYIELDCGVIVMVQYDAESHAVVLQLAPGNDYTSEARLRLTTTAQTNTSAKYDTVEAYPIERAAKVIPVSTSQSTVVVLKRLDG